MSSNKPAAGPVGIGVGEKIRTVRRERKLTLEALSDRIAELGRTLDISALARMEKGQRRIDVDDLMVLADALEIPPSQLLATDPTAPTDAGSRDRSAHVDAGTVTRRHIDLLEPEGLHAPVDARRAVEVIKGYLEAEFGSLRSELGPRSLTDSSMDPVFYAGALTAFAVRSLTNCSNQDAVESITDGPGDNGLDAIYFDRNRHELVLVQTKWSNAGNARPNRADMHKAFAGLESLRAFQFEIFNEATRAKENLIMEAFDDGRLQIRLVLCFPGPLKNISEIVDDYIEGLLARWNRPRSLVSVQAFELTRILDEMGSISPGYDMGFEFILDEWMRVPGTIDSYIGTVSANQIAEWYDTVGESMFDHNIRDHLGQTKVNSVIAESLRTTPENFWLLNNGITILAEHVSVRRPRNSDTSIPSTHAVLISASNASVVNGAQTIGAIYLASTDQVLADTVKVLVRIIVMPPRGEDAIKVSRAANTTNPVASQDIVALDPAQIMIQTELAIELDKVYVIKRSDLAPHPERGCTMSEATIALACTHEDPRLSACALRDPEELWTGNYKDLFGGPPPAYHVWRSVLLHREVVSDLRELAVGSFGRNAAFAEFGVSLVTHIAFQVAHLSLSKPNDIESWIEWLETRGDLSRKIIDALITTVDELFGATSIVSSTFGNPDRCRKIVESISASELPSWIN